MGGRGRRGFREKKGKTGFNKAGSHLLSQKIHNLHWIQKQSSQQVIRQDQKGKNVPEKHTVCGIP